MSQNIPEFCSIPEIVPDYIEIFSKTSTWSNTNTDLLDKFLFA